jgi:hypothetical protein
MGDHGPAHMGNRQDLLFALDLRPFGDCLDVGIGRLLHLIKA